MLGIKLTLEKKWFDMILSGEKTEEYREVKNYWDTRLLPLYVQIDNPNLFEPKNMITYVHFFNGGHFSKELPNFTIEFDGIEFGTGLKELGAIPGKIYHVIKLGKVIDKKNCYEKT